MTKRPLTLEQAQARYVHRYTMDHVPQWARKPSKPDGKYYAPHFRSDQEWYENTQFPGEGMIGKRSKSCMCLNLSWPLGQELTEPFWE